MDAGVREPHGGDRLVGRKRPADQDYPRPFRTAGADLVIAGVPRVVRGTSPACGSSADGGAGRRGTGALLLSLASRASADWSCARGLAENRLFLSMDAYGRAW